MTEVYNGMPASNLAVVWTKSSYSGPQGGNCVEVAPTITGEVAMRNSRFAKDPALVFTREEWRAFKSGVEAGEFDDLTT